MPDTSSIGVSVRGLCKSYGEILAVDHVSFEIEAGRILALLGANGAGKSTTVHMLLGLLPPSSGSVEIAGVDVARDVAVYAGFWASVALVIQAWFRTASASGVMCLAAWAGFVILLPTALAAIAEANTPIPSRMERTDASREAARKASIEAEGLLSRYLEDHPELAAARTNTSDFYARRVVMDGAIAAARAPVERRFFEAVARRKTIVHRLALASPVSLLALTLDELGGSSDERVGRFRRDVNAFQSSFAAFFNDKTMRGERLSIEALVNRPTFRFVESSAAVWPLLALAAWSLALLGLAMLSFRRAVSL